MVRLTVNAINSTQLKFIDKR